MSHRIMTQGATIDSLSPNNFNLMVIPPLVNFVRLMAYNLEKDAERRGRRGGRAVFMVVRESSKARARAPSPIGRPLNQGGKPAYWDNIYVGCLKYYEVLGILFYYIVVAYFWKAWISAKLFTRFRRPLRERGSEPTITSWAKNLLLHVSSLEKAPLGWNTPPPKKCLVLLVKILQISSFWDPSCKDQCN